MKNYYEILGVPPNTSKEEIKRAYSILAHQFHPDKNNGNEKRFKEITEAYRILSGNKTREEYDKLFHSSFQEKQSENNQKKNHSQDNVFKKETAQSVIKQSTSTIIGIIVIIIVIIILIITILTNNDNSKENSDTYSLSSNYSITESAVDDFINSKNILNNENNKTTINLKEKCINESWIKICDLKYSSEDVSGINYRNVFTEGNDVACVDMTNGEIIRNTPDKIRASKNPSYCVSDYGYVYIDPSLNVSKFYGKITRDSDSYPSPYKINTQYDTCLWTYEDGNGAIPYLEILSSVGNRSGYSVAAFCKNNQSGVDIYTYKE